MFSLIGERQSWVQAMLNPILTLARRRACRSTCEDDAEIERESQLGAADLDMILTAAEGSDDELGQTISAGD